MHPTQKSNSKTIATVVVAVILVASGFVMLLSARAMPDPDGPVITSRETR